MVINMQRSAITWSDWLSQVHFRLAIVLQLSLGFLSCLRAAFVAMPQFDITFSVMQSETCVVNILVVVIGVHTTVTCLLTYLSFSIFLFLVFRNSSNLRIPQLVHNIVLDIRGCRKFLLIALTVISVLVMQTFSLRYASWHFFFVRNKWLHNFPVVIQILHLLPTTLFFSETVAQGFFLIGVFVSPDVLQAIAETHGKKFVKHVRVFAGLNISLIVYSASAMYIAYRYEFDNGETNAIIPVWLGEVMFRCLSVAAAQYIEKSLCVDRCQEQMQYENQADSTNESSSDDDCAEVPALAVQEPAKLPVIPEHQPNPSDDDFAEVSALAVQEPAKLPVNPEHHPKPFLCPCGGEKYSTRDSKRNCSRNELVMLHSSYRIPNESINSDTQ